MTYQDGSTTTYIYDEGNRLVQINDSSSGVITRNYDGFNRLISETTPTGTVGYFYDAAGRRTSMSVPGQGDVLYTYDDANRLIQITQGSSVTSFSYDDAGRRTSKTLPNGVSVDYTYDAASLITEMIYRNGSNVLGNLTYQYNSLGQIVSTGGSFARTLIPSAVSSSSYDAANQQLGFGTNSYTFDANMNRLTASTSAGTTNYTWNARNQLTAISGPGVTATFTYDGLGRQQSATVNGVLTEFLFDGSVPIRESAGATVTANNLTFPGANEFIARTASSTTTYFLTDRSRSTVALTDPNGLIQTEYSYAFVGGASVLTGAPSSNPYQFRGSYNDATGNRRPTGGGGSPQIDPLALLPLALQPQLQPQPIFIPSNWLPDDSDNPDPGDPSSPGAPSSPAGGPEGGRKSGGGGAAGSLPVGGSVAVGGGIPAGGFDPIPNEQANGNLGGASPLTPSSPGTSSEIPRTPTMPYNPYGGFQDIATITTGMFDNRLAHGAKEVAVGAAAMGTGYTLMGIGAYLMGASVGTGPAAPVVALAGAMTFGGGATLFGFGGVFAYNAVVGH